jgi:hypothetical protein
VGFLDAFVLGAPVLEPDLDLGLAQPQALCQLTAPAAKYSTGTASREFFLNFVAECSYYRDNVARFFLPKILI